MILLLQNTDKRGNMSMQSKVNEAAKEKIVVIIVPRQWHARIVTWLVLMKKQQKNLTQGFCCWYWRQYGSNMWSDNRCS